MIISYHDAGYSVLNCASYFGSFYATLKDWVKTVISQVFSKAI